MNNAWIRTRDNATGTNMSKYIAERKLLYSEKGSNDRREMVIRIGVPYLLEVGMVSFPIKQGFAGCHIDIDGINETYPDVYGADTLQALQLATNIEPFLKRLQKQYDLFFVTGEPYFEENE
jgi:hypothetical protein